MNLRVNIGCGTNPTNGWLNMDNSLAIKLANSTNLNLYERVESSIY